VSRYTLTVEGPNGNACQPLPSVTEIIGATLAKPQLLDWYYSTTVDSIETLLDTFKDVPEDGLEAWLEINKLRPHDIRDEAAGRGTAAHEYLARLANGMGELGAIAFGAETVFTEAIRHWWEFRKPKVLASEMVLYSLRHGFAGTCDLVVELDRAPTVGTEVALIDLKTRKANALPKAYTSDMLQLSAYKLAWDEMHPENPIQATYALLALDDGSWRMVDTHLSGDVFLSLLDVYRGLRGVSNGR
jgi:hypothetical protein